MAHGKHPLQEPILAHISKDFTTLREDLTVQQALDAIRQRGAAEKIIYFYVVDADERLVGVLPTRRLLTSPLEQRLSDIMVTRVVAVSHATTVLEVCEFFILYKFLALPVVDEQRRIVGVVDVGLLSREVFDMTEREEKDELFEAIGFHLSQVRGASPTKAFRFRFPWLLATIGSGTVCALLASVFEKTLAHSIILAFFMALVLGLSESVGIQSMTVTIQALRSSRPTSRWYLGAFRREMGTAFLLGGACGAAVGLIVWFWRGAGLAACVIGSSTCLALCAACFFGLTVPSLLHAFKLDPKIAAGPITLALTDVSTILLYFTLGALFL